MAASNQKKERVLKAASRIFFEKGFAQASISEIAKTAGVRETLIYELFAGKEDLLFHIPIENTNILIENLQEHLNGLKGAENKLRKIVWHYLNFMQNNVDYATLVLFELRPNRRFYNTTIAYDSFRYYNRIVMGILREGIDEGLFYRTTDLYLLRNLIYGAMDHIICGWLLFNRPENIVAQEDALFDLLIRAARIAIPKEGGNADDQQSIEWSLDKRIAILRAAERIFAEKGFDKARITDIAKTLAIGEATLYEYFKNKEDILFTILEDRTKRLVASVTEELDRSHQAEVELRVFIRHYLTYLETNRDYAAILLFELRPNQRFYVSEPYATIKNYNDILIGILKRGQANGIFRNDANIYLARHMIFGAIDHTVLTWLLRGKPDSLSATADHLTWLYLNALRG